MRCSNGKKEGRCSDMGLAGGNLRAKGRFAAGLARAAWALRSDAAWALRSDVVSVVHSRSYQGNNQCCDDVTDERSSEAPCASRHSSSRIWLALQGEGGVWLPMGGGKSSTGNVVQTFTIKGALAV